MTVKILLVDDSEEMRRSLRKLLEMEPHLEVIGEAENGAVAVEKALKLQPDLVIMDVNMPVMNGIEATEKISLHCPKTAVIISSVQGERDYFRKAMAAGAKDYLVKPIEAEQLLDAVEAIYAFEKKRQARVKTNLLEDHLTEQSKTVALISSKGGVGKTTIAVNLATTAARLGKKVCIVDFDLQFGDAAMFLSLSNLRRNIFHLVRDNDELDSEVIGNYLLDHESGVKVLAAPIKPEESEYITVDHVREILQTLSEMFQLVIIDTAPLTNDLFFNILERCDIVNLVSTPSLPILKNNHNLLKLLDTLGIPQEKVKILLNRCYSKTGVRQRDVMDVLGRDLFWELPNDFQFVDSSVNDGIPFAWKQPTHRLSRQMELLCQLMIGEQKRRGLASKLRKGRWKLFG